MENFLDTDQYSFSVAQAILEHYPDAQVSYQFIDRKLTPIRSPFVFLEKLQSKIKGFADISLDMDFESLAYLKGFAFFKKNFIEFLKSYRFDPDQVHANIIDGRLQLEITGPWAETIFWEVPLLAVITELYMEDQGFAPNLDIHLEKIEKGIETLKGLRFIEFGTRRRHNFAYQNAVLKLLSDKSKVRDKNFKFLGTSNVYLAHKYGLAALGTMSHQLFMGVAAIEGFQRANEITLEKWAQTYQGRLGTALIDTFGTPAFLRGFTGIFPCLFKGLRQDSGDPIEIAKLILQHYRKNDIDLQGRTVYFSDGLTPDKCRKIADDPALASINKVFCVGSYLTNDNPINIVIKLRSCNGVPCVKLSDELRKSFSSDLTTLEYAKKLFR